MAYFLVHLKICDTRVVLAWPLTLSFQNSGCADRARGEQSLAP